MNLGFEFSKAAAKPKRESLDTAPIKEPMRGTDAAAVRRKPSTDQKKVRRQMGKKAARTPEELYGYEPGDVNFPEHLRDVPDSWLHADGDQVFIDGEQVTYVGSDWLGRPAPEGKVWVEWGGDVTAVSPDEISTTASKENSMSRQREAQLLQAMAKADLPEQRRLMAELEDLRRAVSQSVQAERDLDLADTVIRDTLTPVRVHERHTASTDWLDEVVTATGDYDHAMRTEATVWFGQVHEAVKADAEEFAEQARGMARRVAGQFGEEADAAVHAFLAEVERLAAKHSPGQADTDQSGNAESTVTDYDTKADQDPWLDEDWSDDVVFEHHPPMPGAGEGPEAIQTPTASRRTASGRWLVTLLNPQGSETFVSTTSEESARQEAEMMESAGFTVVSIEPADLSAGFGGVPGMEVTVGSRRTADESLERDDNFARGYGEGQRIAEEGRSLPSFPPPGMDDDVWEGIFRGYEDAKRGHTLASRRTAGEVPENFKESDDDAKDCTACEGKGKVPDGEGDIKDCDACGGSGEAEDIDTAKESSRRTANEDYGRPAPGDRVQTDQGLGTVVSLDVPDYPTAQVRLDDGTVISHVLPREARRRTAAEGDVCAVCGDPIAKTDGEWHHDSGEVHDHEAVPADSSKESRRVTAVSLTNVGIEGEHGVGTDPDGNRVKFRLSDSDRESLKSVLFSDLAVNFSGVDVDQDDIISEGSRKTAARSLGDIARDIRQEWGGNVNFAAKPYLDAMSSLDSIHDSYGADSAKTIVAYFLSNASSFRGERAKELKAELKALQKGATKTAASYAGDPYWLTTRYPGTCSKCHGPIAKGEEAFYYPRGKKLLCKTNGCADAASRDFESHAFDEMMMSGSKTADRLVMGPDDSAGRWAPFASKEDVPPEALQAYWNYVGDLVSYSDAAYVVPLQFSAWYPSYQRDPAGAQRAGSKTAANPQSGHAESELPTPEDDPRIMWPVELEEEVLVGQDAAQAGTPTPGGEAGYPQPKHSTREVPLPAQGRTADFASRVQAGLQAMEDDSRPFAGRSASLHKEADHGRVMSLIEQAAQVAHSTAANIPDSGTSIFAYLYLDEAATAELNFPVDEWGRSGVIRRDGYIVFPSGIDRDVAYVSFGLGQGSTRLDPAYKAAEEFLQANGIDAFYASRMD